MKAEKLSLARVKSPYLSWLQELMKPRRCSSNEEEALEAMPNLAVNDGIPDLGRVWATYE